MALDPTGDIVTLLGALVDIPSESRDEGAIADAIEAALAAASGRIYGRSGAAELLGMKATTLASRIKVLGIGKRG